MSERSPDEVAADNRLAAFHEALLEGHPPAPVAERQADPLAAAEQCLLLFERVRRQAGEHDSGWLFDAAAADWSAERPHALDSRFAALVEPSHDGPRQIGRFVIQRRIGEGGFGIVFLALDPDLNRQVALKLPRPEVLISPTWRERFLREAEAAAALDHPGIVPVFEVGRAGTLCYIVQAWCEGLSLDRWLTANPGRVSPQAAADLCVQLADAVQHAHSRGVLHRDIKPSNILLEAATSSPPCQPSPGAETAEVRSAATVSEAPAADQPAERVAPAAGGSPQLAGEELAASARLTDFGLARLIDRHDQTRSGAVVGTPSYMAPEQAEGKTRELGVACDVYALGAVLYELLTGRPPFLEDSLLATLQAVREREPARPRQRNPKIPRDLEAICLKCLEKDPRRRYATARELEDDLRRFRRGEVVEARPVGSLARLARWSRRNPLLAGLAVTAAALLIGISVISTLAAVRLENQRRALAKSLARTTSAERAAGQSERVARWRLYRSLVSQAAAEQASGREGQRTRSLAAIADAAGVARELGLDAAGMRRLRNEAVKSLSLVDLPLDCRWPLAHSSGVDSGAAFDPDLEHYAVPHPAGVGATVYRVADNQPLRQLVANDVADLRGVLEFGPAGGFGDYICRKPPGPHRGLAPGDWRRCARGRRRIQDAAELPAVLVQS